MVEISRARIKRQAYRFEVKKKFQYLGHYKTKVRPPIEKIKDQLNKLIGSKKPEKKLAEPTIAKAPPGGFNFVVFGAALLIALIILMMAWLYLTTQVLVPQAGNIKQPEKPSIDNAILKGDILTAGDRGSEDHIAAILVNYSAQNINNYTVRLTTYSTKVPSQVFILSSDRLVDATTYPAFLRNLRSNLARRQMMVNEITTKELETMPDGAIVIVPTGVVPKELLGVNSSLSMDKLGDRGVVVVYIGQPFTKMLDGKDVVQTPQSVLQSLPVSFNENAPLSQSPDFHLYQPLYAATSRGYWGTSTVYGSVSILKKGNGAFVFVPQTLDGGWRGNVTSVGDPVTAAEDIAKIVVDTPWAESSGPPKEYRFENQTNLSGVRYFFSEPFKGSSTAIKVEFIGNSSTSNYLVQETLFTSLQQVQRGELYVDGGVKVVSTNITNLQTRLNARLQEPAPAQPSMFLVFSDISGTEVQNFPQGSVDVQAEKPFDVPIYVDRGEYLVKLQDDDGQVYAESYLNVVTIDVTFTGGSEQKRSLYSFASTMAGAPVPLKDVSVKVDDGRLGTYKFNDVSTFVVDVGAYTGGDYLPFGKHTFEFSSGGLRITVPVDRPTPQTIFTNPMFLITAVLTLGIVGVGILFARQESIFFSIDIPDFPPVARTKVPLSPDVVLSIFQKVNENYRWQNTPLTSSEVKNGFKDIFYKGRPVYVTDYNVEYLLDELEKKGLTKESMGYYGLAGWEDKAKHSINYLAMMRRLRDICVNNAIPFTSIGESETSDSEITVVGQQMSLHFFEKGMDVALLLKRVLSTIGKGITIILFKSDSDKAAFQSMMHSPSAAPLIMKLEAESGSLQMLTVEEFEKMLLEFKSM